MSEAAGNGTRRKMTCVTGGNGYIASALIKMLLDKGYAVKTMVRNPDDVEKNSHLKDLESLGSLEVYRADLEEEGSFDDFLAGCDYAFLVAAPVNLNAENPEEQVIKPAVRGILNVMRSCIKAGTVKRVILTSSVAAVSCRPLEGDGHVLDEKSWADVEFLTANKKGHWGYPVSKVLLEKAARELAEESSISLVTVCPVIVVGAAPAPQAMTSVSLVLSLLSGDEALARTLRLIEGASGAIAVVHINDLCCALLFVDEEKAASGRYICCSLNTTTVELAGFLAAKYPQYNVEAERFGGLPEKPRVCISSAKLIGEGFEYEYMTLDGIYDDVVDYGRALGILPY